MTLPSFLLAVSACASSPSAYHDAGVADGAALADAMAFVVRTCADDQAPIRDRDGSFVCTVVGAARSGGTGLWPAVDPAQGIVWVNPGAPPEGVGSRERPFRRVEDAARQLEREGGGTIVLSRGVHALDAPLSVSMAASIVGIDADAASGSVIKAHFNQSAIVVAAGELSMRGIVVSRDVPDAGVADDNVAALVVQRSATLRLRDVSVLRPNIGILSDGRLDADGLTIRNASRSGVGLLAHARANLRRVLIRDGDGPGVQVVGGHLHLREALIHHNAEWGLYLREANDARVDTMGGAAACTADGPSAEPGPFDCIGLAAITCNGIAAVQVTADGAVREGQRRVDIRRSVFSGTLITARHPSAADGIVVNNAAEVIVDADANAPNTGSEIVGNARVGVLVQGPGANLRLRGGSIADNTNGGVFVTAQGRVGELAVSELAFNRALGIGVASSASLGSLTGNRIRDTAMGQAPAMPLAPMIADGISASRANVGDVTGNDISRNDRYAGVFCVSSGVVRNNTGSSNGYGIVSYDGTSFIDRSTNTLVNTRAAPPPSCPPQASIAELPVR